MHDDKGASLQEIARHLQEISATLAKNSALQLGTPDFAQHLAWSVSGHPPAIEPAPGFEALALDMFVGAEDHTDALLANTRAFAAGHPANDALLWGARGVGKSALVRSVVAEIARTAPHLKLLGLDRDGLTAFPALTRAITHLPFRFVVLLDDLSFDPTEPAARALKPFLDGGVGLRPDNVLVYATSNRRHLIARSGADNPQDLRPGETLEEQVSLSDRFGLWLGFHALDQTQYLEIVARYATHLGIENTRTFQAEALLWSRTRGGRSGRVARQFVVDYCLQNGIAFQLTGRK